MHFAHKFKKEIGNIQWDMVVIDEAHHLRNVYKKNNKISNSIKEATARNFKLLLTATPLQNSLMELYGLISIIDNDIFPDKSYFKSRYATDADQKDIEELKNRLKKYIRRSLRKDVTEFISYTERISMVVNFSASDKEKELYNRILFHIS